MCFGNSGFGAWNSFRISCFVLRASCFEFLRLPVSHASITIEDALGQLLLERMFFYFSLIDRDAEAGAGIRANESALFFNGEAFLNDILPPGHVLVNRLADDVTGLRETKL